ncbi:hypothetical protein HYV73_03405 [Candidatus Uhrbacteria bacterium]|nr:hypothetical protein [Candidatus Uhrbacteria bacterium]
MNEKDSSTGELTFPTCEDVKLFLSDKEVDTWETEELEEVLNGHLESCDRCATWFNEYMDQVEGETKRIRKDLKIETWRAKQALLIAQRRRKMN